METFDLNLLNKEFQGLLSKHENDKEFANEQDRKNWSWLCGDDPVIMEGNACICNAWRELLQNHKGLEAVADWSFGAPKQWGNTWDVFVGFKNEIY